MHMTRIASRRGLARSRSPIVVAACSGGGGSSKAATATTAADLGGMDELVEGRRGRRRPQRHRGAAGLGQLQGRSSRSSRPSTKHQGRRAGPGLQQPAGDRRRQQPEGHRQGTGRPRPRARASRSPTPALFAPYQVAAWADIPDNLKESTGLWFSDYAGLHVRRLRRQQGGGAGDRGRHAQARVQGHDRPQRQSQGGLGRLPRRGHGRAGEWRLGGRHLRRA